MINGAISISPSLTSLSNVVIFQHHMRIVYTYRILFVIKELARHMIGFNFEAICWQKNLMSQGFQMSRYRQLSTNVMVVTTILFTHATFLWTTCCLICFIIIVKPFLILILTMVHTVYLIWKKGSRQVWSIDRGYLLSIAPDSISDIFRGQCAPTLWFVFPIGLMRLNTVRYILSFHAVNINSILNHKNEQSCIPPYFNMKPTPCISL
jgi:hypothetical protein